VGGGGCVGVGGGGGGGGGAELLVKRIPGRPIRRQEDEIPKCFRLIRSL